MMLFSNEHIKTQRREVGASPTPLTSHTKGTRDMAKAILAFPHLFHNRTLVPALALKCEVRHG